MDILDLVFPPWNTVFHQECVMSSTSACRARAPGFKRVRAPTLLALFLPGGRNRRFQQLGQWLSGADEACDPR